MLTPEQAQAVLEAARLSDYGCARRRVAAAALPADLRTPVRALLKEDPAGQPFADRQAWSAAIEAALEVLGMLGPADRGRVFTAVFPRLAVGSKGS
jgi:hypothetical protein